MTTWHTSTSSGGANCIEVGAIRYGGIGIRHSRFPASSLEFTPAEWDAFVAGVKAGEFDHLKSIGEFDHLTGDPQ